MSSEQHKREQHKRKGAVLIAVLVCMGLIGLLMFSAMQTSLRQRKQLQRELQMEQTRWLAEGGIAHATQLTGSAEELDDDPVILRPKLDTNKVCEVKIELLEKEGSIEASVTAWIGLEDRPELQTRQHLTKEIKKPSGD